jgi:FixJ family two-component response regulator
MKSGAIEFLTKPLNEQELLDAIQAGIERDRARREEARLAAAVRVLDPALAADHGSGSRTSRSRTEPA